MRPVLLLIATTLVSMSVAASAQLGERFDSVILDVDVAECALSPLTLDLVGGESYRVRVHNPSLTDQVVYVSGLNVQTQAIPSGAYEDLRFRTPTTPSTFIIECAPTEGASRVAAGTILVDGGAPVESDDFLASLPGGASTVVLLASTLVSTLIVAVVLVRRWRRRA